MIRRLVGAYGRAIDAFDRVVLAVSALLLGAVVVLTAVEIIGRNVFLRSSPEAVDVTLSLAVLIYFVGYLVLLNREQDVMMDYFYARFPAGLRRALDAATAVAILVFFVILLVKSWRLFELGLSSLHPVFPVPHGIVALPAVVGAAGCVLVALRKALDALLALGGSGEKTDPGR
jgi:TRAP-type C4-dicarboxylate transport system permease small subunit